MESFLTDEELDALEEAPLEERVTRLEEVEQTLRATLDDAAPA